MQNKVLQEIKSILLKYDLDNTLYPEATNKNETTYCIRVQDNEILLRSDGIENEEYNGKPIDIDLIFRIGSSYS